MKRPKPDTIRILHLEDNERDATMMRDMLEARWPDCRITVVDTRDDYLKEIGSGEHHIVVSDYKMPGFSGLEALNLVRELAPDLPFIFFSGTIGEERAIDAVHAGAADYVIKDRMQRLPIAIERVLHDAEERRARRLVEEELTQERYLMRILMENLPDSVFFKDADSRYISVSHSHARSHGRKVAEMIGLTNHDLFDRGFADESRAAELEIMRTGQPLLAKEERVLWPDGRVTWALMTKLPLHDTDGRIVGTFGIAHDITERKKSEERILQLVSVIDHSPVAITISGLDRHLTYLNAGAREFYEVEAIDLLDRKLAEVISEESAAELTAGWEKAMRDGSWTGEVAVVTRTGRTIQSQIQKWRILDSRGQPTGCLTIAIDITERKALERQFLRSQRLEAIGTLAGGVAHDLNNVLAPIMMGVEMLRDELPGQREVFETMLGSVTRGAELVKLLLSYAKGSEGVRIPISLERLVLDFVPILKGSFPKNIKLSVDCEPGLPMIMGDRTQLHQVLLNLCVNARDAMPDGGLLRLEICMREIDAEAGTAFLDLKPGRYVLLEVADTGAGIPPQIKDRILEPFFTTKEPDKGTGLGLSTVAGIVKGHGGALQVHSIVGQGATFTVFLPVAVGETEAGLPENFEEVLRGGGEAVLFVDDEAAVREVARAVMGRLNYRPITAADGHDGLVQALLHRSEIRAIIVDVHMPRMDGVEFVRLIRRMMPHTPVMIMSGGLEAGEEAAIRELGVEARITKPFTEPLFAKGLRQLLA